MYPPELLFCAVTLDHHPSAELPITGCYRRIEPKQLLRPKYVKAKSKIERPPGHQPTELRLLLPSAHKSGQAVERGVEQAAQARALVEAGENRAGLLLEHSMTDFVGSAFQ